MKRGVLLDTGPLVAVINSRDVCHSRCVKALEDIAPPLITCWPVITEVAWLLREDIRAQRLLVKAHEEQLFVIEELDPAALSWIFKYLERYKTKQIQLADVSLVYLAEKLALRTVFTLDVRDFSFLRKNGKHALELIPIPSLLR